MKKFYIMVGNIGGGKSTYIKNNFPDARVISKDGIRYSLGGGTYIFDTNIEHIVHYTTIYLTKNLCANQIDTLVLDETNVQKKGRKQFIKIAKENGYLVIAVRLPNFPKEIAVDRRLSNPHDQWERTVWEGVWDKFQNKFQAPTLEEGFDEIIQVEVEDVT